MDTVLDEIKEEAINENSKLNLSSKNFTKELIYESDNSFGDDRIKLRIAHFNDVYNIESSRREPKAGASRFINAVNTLKQEEDLLVLFSGDAFSPSTISYATKGKHMVPILNRLQLAASCIGNHDFDFGVEVLEDLISESNFPWLMSNVIDAHTNKTLAQAETKIIIDFNGIKIGIIGLVEIEWIETLSTLNYDDIIYEPFVDAGRRLANELKKEDKCDYVIALTHMRMPNDMKLAQEVPEIDIVLGGHDHNYKYEKVNNTFVLKSGTDFRDLSLIEINFKSDKSKSELKRIERFVIDSNVEEDPEVNEIIDHFLSQGEKGLERVLGHFSVDLDGRFCVVRSMESNLGNFISDVVLELVNADCVIINSGTLRSDSIIPKGPFTVGDLKQIIPFHDTILTLEVDGNTLHQVLENSVSQYPKLEGRFPQVGGIKFFFDPSMPSGNRVDPRLVRIKDKPLQLDQNYRLATKLFLKEGKDGYHMLENCKTLVDEEQGPLMFTLVESYFERIKKIKADLKSSIFCSNKVTLARRTSLIEEIIHSEVNRTDLNDLKKRKMSCPHSNQEEKIDDIDANNNFQEIDFKSIRLAPVIDGRINIITSKEEFDKLLIEFDNSLKIDKNS